MFIQLEISLSKDHQGQGSLSTDETATNLACITVEKSTQWTSIKRENKESNLSLPVDDQCFPILPSPKIIKSKILLSTRLFKQKTDTAYLLNA